MADRTAVVGSRDMTMLRRARKEGRKYLNPVPTTIGGFGTIFKVLPRFLSSKEEKTPKRPLGPFRTDVSVYGGGAGEWVAGDVDGPLVYAAGDRWGAGADRSGVG